MTHQLSADISARIHAQIATGQFSNEDDLIRQALDALEVRERGLRSIREMVREAEKDVHEGRVGIFDIEQTMTRIQSRLANS
jgi:Arc/MetJ-type ribon-helix-helix transcriptional regulator